MPSISVQVDGHDEPIDLDLDLGAMTLREAERFQRGIGNRRFDEVMRTGQIAVRADELSALIYAKLATQVPDLAADGFDLDFGELIEALASDGADEGKASADS